MGEKIQHQKMMLGKKISNKMFQAYLMICVFQIKKTRGEKKNEN